MNQAPGPDSFSEAALKPALKQALDTLRADLERQAPPPLPAAAREALLGRMAAGIGTAPDAANGAATGAVRGTAPRTARSAGAALRFWLQRWPAWPSVAACAAVILLSVLLMWQPRRTVEPVAPADSAFVPIVPAERWALLTSAPESPAWLISAELSQQRLGQFGLPYDPARAAEMRKAQLLVAPSGEVLAVRLLQ